MSIKYNNCAQNKNMSCSSTYYNKINRKSSEEKRLKGIEIDIEIMEKKMEQFEQMQLKMEQMEKKIAVIIKENENMQKKIIQLEFRPNEVINCPSCNIDIEIDKGGINFNESKNDFNNIKEKLSTS